MTCLTSADRKRAVVCLVTLLVGAAAALRGRRLGRQCRDGYQSGKEAYDKGDCLTAADHRFALRNVAQDRIDSGRLNSLNGATARYGAQISLALRTKEELDQYGHSTERETKTSGKTDGEQQ